MKFIHRLGYYLGGFSIGLVVLAFFLSGKKASCDYFPDARVLKNIRQKERDYSEQALRVMQQYHIDTADITAILDKGNVIFDRSNTEGDSCHTYLVTGKRKPLELELFFENCDSTATLRTLKVLK